MPILTTARRRKYPTTRPYTKRSPIWRTLAIQRATGMTIPQLLSAVAARTAGR